MSDDLETKSRPELMKMCAAAGVVFQPSHKAEDLRNLLRDRIKHGHLAAPATGNQIPAGHTRIQLQRMSDTKVPLIVSVNGDYQCWIPWDGQWDIPNEAFEALQRSTTTIWTAKVDETTGQIRKEKNVVSAYPFHFIGQSPGPSGKVKPAMSPEKYGLRKLFHEIYGRYPKVRRGEQGNEWQMFSDAVAKIKLEKRMGNGPDSISKNREVIKELLTGATE